MTVKMILSAALLGWLTMGVTPAAAQTTSECTAMFHAADLNNDGLLSASEIAASEEITGDIVDALASEDEVSRQEFLTACRD